jgi:hypothetical protein
VFVLFKDRPFFELDDDPTSEEIENLRKPAPKKPISTFPSLNLREIDKID